MEHSKGEATVTVMAPDYDIENLGEVMLRAKEDAALSNTTEMVSGDVEFVVRGANDDKTIQSASASATFTTLGDGSGNAVPGDTNGDGIVDLIDLSNIIDMFGIKSDNLEWQTRYTFFDYNNNGEIDIYDIAFVAKLI